MKSKTTRGSGRYRLIAAMVTLALMSSFAMFAPSAYAEPVDDTQALTLSDVAQSDAVVGDDGTDESTDTGDGSASSADSSQTSDADGSETGGTTSGQEDEDGQSSETQDAQDAEEPSQESEQEGTAADNGDAGNDGTTADNDQGTADSQDVAVQSDGDAVSRSVDNPQYTVQGVSPRGTTINLFDYWLTDRDAEDTSTPSGYVNLGINKGHRLHFTWGGHDSVDTDTSGCRPNNFQGAGNPPCYNIVGNKLVNGYPVLQERLGSTESLDYLFNADSFDGKAVYTGVDGLLQVDDQGYYYYDSHSNFAQFNDDGKGSGDFTLYNTWGVYPSGTSPNGQFFPFNTGDQVFSEGSDGTIKANTSFKSGSSDVNHYFGLTMSTRFVQQYGGHTAPEGTDGRLPVTYNFSGDDDVWIYIDGVLVGDLGGIHDAASLQIDFSTGVVTTYQDKDHDNMFDPGETNQQTTLRDLFKNAGVESGFASGTDTFADDSYHTLDFFYLERGGYDSNMSLKYNLVNIPESGIVKVDQDGRRIGNVKFTLENANDQYVACSSEGANCANDDVKVTGTTDSNGELVFTRKNEAGQDFPITLTELQARGGDKWILHEENIPKGYRSSGDMHLYFDKGLLLSANEWDTGAWSQPQVTVRADTTAYVYNSSDTVKLDTGVTYAVVLKKDGDNWYPVSGSHATGWTVASDSSGDAILGAAQSYQDNHRFVLGTGGAYETTIDELPGDVNTYYYRLLQMGESVESARDQAEYTIGYFHFDTDPNGDPDAGTMQRVQANATDVDGNLDTTKSFERVFSVTLNVPNIKNELKLVKTDVTDSENVAPMSNVEFKLYDSSDVSNGVPKKGADPVNTMTTGANGGLNVTTNGSLLANGDYVLIETTPKGYYDEHTAVHIIVDGSGVHVDAGTADDNVSVETGIGTLVYSMRSFAADDAVDTTLHDVVARSQSGTYTYNAGSTGGTWEWPDATVGSEIHYQYNDDPDESLHYVPEDPNVSSYVAESGWSRLAVTQCDDPEHKADTTGGIWEKLGDTDLSNLFTSDVTIHVTNVKAKGSFIIQKVLNGRPWDADDSFEFTVSPDDSTEDAITSGFVVLPTTADDDEPWGSDNNPVDIGEDNTVTIPAASESESGESLEHAVSYGDILFTQQGTYRFTVVEKQGSLPGVDYSTAEFTVQFKVTDQTTNNQWEAPTVSMTITDVTQIPADGSVIERNNVQYGVQFINDFTPVSSLPLTGGDMTARAFGVAGGVVLLLAGLAWLLARRRRV